MPSGLKRSYMHRVHAFNGFSEIFGGTEEDHLCRGQLFASCFYIIHLVTEWEHYKLGTQKCFKIFFLVFLTIIFMNNLRKRI